MGKISLDLNSFKAAGIYTLEIDNTARVAEADVDSLRMIVGFSNKGPFNRPVLLQEDTDRLRVFGDVDPKLEHKGCFFNRMTRTLLTGGPVIALNLLNVNPAYSGPDQVNIATLSMSAGEANPVCSDSDNNYGEYDYLADSIDRKIYGTTKGDNLPYVGKTPFASVYNRSRFWVPDKDLLTAEAARNLAVPENPTSNTYETGNLLNFANVGTEEISILVFKPASMPGYEVTAESWFGGKENIPFGWIRPYDNISDYFLQVVCVKGNWTNYPVLSTDPVWKGYFNKKGIKKNRVNQFMAAEGITVLGSWTGCIIPDFTDKQGNMLSLEKKVNAATERTGLLMSFNQDAANVLIYDYSGYNASAGNPEIGCWGLDIDGDNETGEAGKAEFIVDMVGHEAFMKTQNSSIEWIDFGGDGIKSLDASGSVKDLNSGNWKTIKTTTKSTNNICLYVATNTSIADVSYKNKLNALSDNTSSGWYIFGSSEILNSSVDPSTVLNKANICALVNNKKFELSNMGKLYDRGTFSLQDTSTQKVNLEATTGTVKTESTFILDNSTFKISYTVNYNVQKVDDTSVAYINATEPVTPNIASLQVLKSEGSLRATGINFLSYNYIYDVSDGVIANVSSARYFSEAALWEEGGCPVSEDTKNMFILTDVSTFDDKFIKLGDYVKNITYNNEAGQTEEYQLIPGLTKVIRKQFVQVNDETITYQGHPYKYNGDAVEYKGNYGFYLITCTAPVLIENNKVTRQLPISDPAISESLRFIPMKGLTLTSKHRPGYDQSGNLDIEGGIEKVYSVLNDEGIKRGLMNDQMVNFRYIIDSMSYGLGAELGGKVWISRTAMDRQKCTAILNLPSAKQFAVSSNPYFCDTYTPGAEARPSMNTKYIPEGGNTEMGSTIVFSLPLEEDGAKFTACFWPHLTYQEAGKTISVPPAADVANVLNRKFNGINDPYAISANQNGILSNKYLAGLEFLADREDREYLEPFGVNTIIKDQGSIMIYGNQTAYQAMKSDFNKLHVRENLNTAEIECEKVLKKYNFLYNTPAVRANIVQQLTPVLSAMQISGALVKYEIICDETNNTPDVIEADTCVVEINLWMNHGMEKIVQKFTLHRLSDQ